MALPLNIDDMKDAKAIVLPNAKTGGCGKCIKLIWDGAAFSIDGGE